MRHNRLRVSGGRLVCVNAVNERIKTVLFPARGGEVDHGAGRKKHDRRLSEFSKKADWHDFLLARAGGFERSESDGGRSA